MFMSCSAQCSVNRTITFNVFLDVDAIKNTLVLIISAYVGDSFMHLSQKCTLANVF